MRATAVVIVAAAGLAVPGAASAKGLALERICGESRCVAIIGAGAIVTRYLGAARPEPPPLPHYRLDYRNAGAPRHYFVPALNLVGPVDAGAGSWFRPDQRALDTIRAAARGLEPLPAPDSWPARAAAQRETRRSLPAALVLILLAAAAVALRSRNHPVARGVGEA